MGGIVGLIVAIIVISAVVGAIAQFLNKLNEANAPPRRGAAVGRRDGGDGVRQTDKDMDRFLAEIDRLRRKNADAAETAQPQSARPAARPAAPALPAKAARTADRQRARPVAEVVQPKPRRVDTTAMAAPPAPVAPGTLSPRSRPDEVLPVATVVSPAPGTGAPTSPRVTRLPQRARPAPKTNLAMNLTGLLNSGQGIAMSVMLVEVLGPPKSRRR